MHFTTLIESASRDGHDLNGYWARIKLHDLRSDLTGVGDLMSC